jgi:hypothetical protein
MKRTLIVMGISIASLSFAVYTQVTHAKNAGNPDLEAKVLKHVVKSNNTARINP